LVAFAALAAPALAATPDPTYADDIAKFRTRADASLTRERGWLSIVSRDELVPGTYKIGSAKDNQIVLPKDLAPAYLGTVTVSKDKARLALAKGNTMQVVAKDFEGENFTERDLVSGATRLEWVTFGRLSLQFVKRDDGKIVVRAADRESPRRKNFPGRVWYEAKTDFKGSTRSTTRATSSSSSATARATRRRIRQDASWSSRSRRTARPGSSTSTRRTTRPARSPRTRPARCRRRRTG